MLPYFIAFGPPVANQPSLTSFFICRGDSWSIFAPDNSSATELSAGLTNSRGLAYCFAFGDGGLFMSYAEGNIKSHEGGKPVFGGCFESHYAKVDDWIKENVSKDPADLSVALGPNGSYWMWSKKTGSVGHNLPPRLVNMLHAWPNNRARLTLGCNGAFLYWDDEGEYNFHGHASMVKFLNQKMVNGIKIVTAALSPFNEFLSFVLLSNGEAFLKVPDNMLGDTQRLVESYKQEWRATYSKESKDG